MLGGSWGADGSKNRTCERGQVQTPKAEVSPRSSLQDAGPQSQGKWGGTPVTCPWQGRAPEVRPGLARAV